MSKFGPKAFRPLTAFALFAWAVTGSHLALGNDLDATVDSMGMTTYEQYRVYEQKYGVNFGITEEEFNKNPDRKKAAQQAVAAKYLQQTGGRAFTSGSEDKTVRVLSESDSYRKESEAMEKEMITGHAFNKAARTGMIGAGHLHAGKSAVEARELAETSQALDTTGKVAQVGTYTGYAAGAATIGAAVMNYTERHNGGSEVATKVNDIAAKASFGVGVINLGTGAYGYMRAREYQDVGLAKIEAMEKQLDKNDPKQLAQLRDLQAAKEKFTEARKDANEAAVGMLIRGATNMAVGSGAIFLNKKIEAEKQNMQPLGSGGQNQASSSELRTASTPSTSTGTDTSTSPGTSTTSGGTAGMSSSGNGSAVAMPGERNLPLDPSPAPTTGGIPATDEKAPNGIAGPAQPVVAVAGGSIASDSALARALGNSGGGKRASGAAAGVSDSGGSGGGALGGAEETPAEEETAASEEANPAGEVAEASSYSGGGGAIRLAGEAPDEGNPMADVFGQIGQLMGGKKDGDPTGGSANLGGRGPASSGASSAQNVVLGAESDLFKSHRQKMFLMKFRGNL